MSGKKGSFADLRTRKFGPEATSQNDSKDLETKATTQRKKEVHSQTRPKKRPSLEGKKLIAFYASEDLSIALRVAAMENKISLKQAMIEASDDWLRKVGKSPIGG